MIDIVKSEKHHYHEEDWLKTYWHFSFADYYDPENLSFGVLRVFNDDIVLPGKGFGFHPHSNMEIVTYVFEGELKHRDNLGNEGVILPGEVQRMSAGTGIIHSEFNNSSTKDLKLLQMWILPERGGIKPSWEQKKFSKDERTNTFLPIVSPMQNRKGASLGIHQDAYFYVSFLNGSLSHSVAGRLAYLFVVSGEIELNGKEMGPKDSAKIRGEKGILLKSSGAEIMMIEMPPE